MSKSYMGKFYLLIIFSLCVFMGCVDKNQSSSPKKMTINLQEGDLPSLNPYVGVDLRSRCLSLSLFEPLMRKGGDDQLQLAAAEKVEIDETQTVYTFHLRPHRWSNGKAVTSYDFARAWTYALMPDSPCFRADLFYPIKNAYHVKKGNLAPESLGIATPDSATLVVTLEHPTPFFLDLTATSFFAPLYKASNEEPQFFNGPYVVKQRVPDALLVLEKNQLYWDVDSVDVQQLHFTMLKDPMTAYALFENEELDLIGDPLCPLPFDLIPSLEKENRLHKKPISRIFYLVINTEKFPLNQKNLRKALSLSIDRQALTDHLFFGEIPTLSPLPTTLSFMTQQHMPGEPAVLFQETLTAMGLSREQFPTITLAYADLSGQKKLAEFLQAQWKEKLGIDVNLLCQEWNVHSANLRKGNYEIGTLHLTTLYQDPMFYLDLLRNKTSHCNYCRWEDPGFQSLLETAEQTSDLKTRDVLLQEAEAYLIEEMPVISLFTQNLQYLMGERLDLEISELGIYDFKQMTIK